MLGVVLGGGEEVYVVIFVRGGLVFFFGESGLYGVVKCL